jgi:hypothetical protein
MFMHASVLIALVIITVLYALAWHDWHDNPSHK